MEKLRLRGSTLQPHTQSGKARPVISGPIIQEGLGEEKLKHLQCLDLVRLQDKTVNPVSCSSPSQSSSSSLESSSAVSTPSPVTKVRSNSKRHGLSKQEDNQKQINEQHFNNQHNLDVNNVFEIPHGHKPGKFPTVLLHNSTFSPINNTSVSWKTGSFHTCDHRVSIYDNVPDHMKILDDVFSDLDCVMERICGLQQLVNSWTDKLQLGQEKTFIIAQMLSMSNPSTDIEAKSAPHVSILQRLSLLRLTALMDKYSPFSKKVPDFFYRKVKPSEHKSRKVFGVPLLKSIQQSGKPLTQSILRAMEFLSTECLDQVGLFRKSGLKSRIQNLRHMVEADPDGMSFENQLAFDVADMLKQYFRDLPEPVFSSKLCESFLLFSYLTETRPEMTSDLTRFDSRQRTREKCKSNLSLLSLNTCITDIQKADRIRTVSHNTAPFLVNSASKQWIT
uniref:Si:dkeyp-23e4.3 n=1 Tax=Sinocyclocheilus grahami TaxID=75366 RepID=A0A672KGK4_SINGR